ncbi:MAG: YggS family pyridoxal phosphate-dependent enzyme [Flavobacteriales bacterium]|nr:YggS family pyridoxal phosphate-dependent enzyme [Flavobacteriales bacterium]
MISQKLAEIQKAIPANVCLVAVSKTKPVSDLLEAYQAGQRHFGENKVQEMTEKWEVLPKDIQWHLIGHLQTNKVKYIAPYVHLIHSVDSLKLLAEINKQGAKNQRVISVLLQFYIAKEETKFGLDFEEAVELLTSDTFKSFNNIHVVGVMGMASFTDDESVVRAEFSQLKAIFTRLKNSFFQNDDSFKEISMGMSGDYQLAIEQGSTMVRVGSSIFGGR